MAESLFVMPFGKYKGQDVEDLPSSYLDWLTEQDFFCDKYRTGLEAVNTELRFRQQFPHERAGVVDEDHNWNRRAK